MVRINSKYYCFDAYIRLNEKAYNYYSCFLKFFYLFRVNAQSQEYLNLMLRKEYLNHDDVSSSCFIIRSLPVQIHESSWIDKGSSFMGLIKLITSLEIWLHNFLSACRLHQPTSLIETPWFECTNYQCVILNLKVVIGWIMNICLCYSLVSFYSCSCKSLSIWIGERMEFFVPDCAIPSQSLWMRSIAVAWNSWSMMSKYRSGYGHWYEDRRYDSSLLKI